MPYVLLIVSGQLMCSFDIDWTTIKFGRAIWLLELLRDKHYTRFRIYIGNQNVDQKQLVWKPSVWPRAITLCPKLDIDCHRSKDDWYYDITVEPLYFCFLPPSNFHAPISPQFFFYKIWFHLQPKSLWQLI